MNVIEFEASVADLEPPQGLSRALQALWREAHGDWHQAHKLAQAQDDAAGAWVHAYLHRVEGDLSNAKHWYRRADKPECRTELKAEWRVIADALL